MLKATRKAVAKRHRSRPHRIPVLTDGKEPLTVRIEQAVNLVNLGETFLRARIKDGSLKSTTRGRTRLIDYQSLKSLALGSPS